MTRKADVVPPGFSFCLRLFTKKRGTSLYQIRLFRSPPSLGTSALKLLSSYVVSIPDRNLFLEPLLVTVLHTASCHGCPGPYPRYYLSNIQKKCPPSHIITNDIDVKAPRTLASILILAIVADSISNPILTFFLPPHHIRDFIRTVRAHGLAYHSKRRSISINSRTMRSSRSWGWDPS